MLLTWRNGGLYFGQDFRRGPNRFHIEISWNNRELLSNRPVPLGEYTYADGMEITWKWPKFRGVEFKRYSMRWDEI